MDPGQIAVGLATNPLAWIATALMVAVAYLFKELRASDRAAMERSAAQEAAHRTTLERVIPIAEKLVSAVDIMERLASREHS